MYYTKFEHYIIKSPETKEEFTGLYELNKAAHGDLTGNTAKKIIERHPDISSENFLIIKDTKENKVVSTLSMFPWKLRYFGLEFKALEMGFVATDNEYKKRGLQRKLNEKREILNR